MPYAVDYYYYGRPERRSYSIWFHPFAADEKEEHYVSLVPYLKEPACNECYWIVPNTEGVS